MLTQLAVSTSPAMPEASVSYVQVGDYLGMLFHQNETAATCPSCHTVNRGSMTRCRACGESMPSADDEQVDLPPPRGVPGRVEASEIRSLRNVLLLVLTPALLLSAVFAGWQALRSESKTLSGPATLASMRPMAPVVPVPALAPRKPLQEAAMVAREARRNDSNAAPPPVEPAAQSDDESMAAPSAPSASAPRKASSRPQAGRLVETDPLAGCRSRGFFARAICINNRCAEPGASRFSQCREALRQRRIDEARRNPTLVG